MTRASELDDMKMHVKLKLALLWTALMFFYIYGDPGCRLVRVEMARA